jgi:NAD(P)-dependent dehydrogenase (short-subunit alcohol dehydrogenase family)
MPQLDGHVSLVTGAGRGLGRGISAALVERGARVALLGRDQERLEAVRSELGREATTAIGCDVADAAQIATAVQQVLEWGGRLDSVVNNAQAASLGPLTDATLEHVQQAFSTGPVAALLFMQQCRPALADSRGAVVNLASGAGVQPQRGMGVYAAAKESVRALTRVAALEWADQGIRVDALCPIATSEGVQMWRERDPDGYAAALRTIPLGHYGDPVRDVGAAVAFLVSEDARYITGTTLMVDGGQAHLG